MGTSMRLSRSPILGILVLAFFAATAPEAAQLSNALAVTVDLQSRATSSTTGVCGTSAVPRPSGPIAKVFCSTQLVWDIARAGDGSLVQVIKSGEILGNVETYTGAGIVTSWRVVSLPNREYLEMTVGW